MFKKITLLFLFLFSLSISSQNLRLIDTANYSLRKELIKKYEAENKIYYKKLKKQYRGKVRKEIISLYKAYDNEFLRNIKKNRFVFDKRFTKYADSILNVITNNNKNLQNNNITVLVSKNPNINALSIGKGIVILNIGLFKYLQNEDQLISVLTHEIAHEKLEHVSKNAIYRAKLESSKARKIQAKKIKKEKYNKYNKSFKIKKELM